MLLQPAGSIFVYRNASPKFISGSSCADPTDMSQSECTVVDFDTSADYNGNPGQSGSINSCSPCGRCTPGSGGASPPSDCAPCVAGQFRTPPGTDCEPCNSGSYCEAGSIVEVLCPARYFTVADRVLPLRY